MTLLALTHRNGIRIAELAFLLAALAGAALAVGALTRLGTRLGVAIGGIGIAVSSVLLIIAIRWGHFR